MGVPAGWIDDGTTLTAPNGYKVVLGFRDYVLNNNWNSVNWPLQNETSYSPIEQSNPSVGNGTRQVFRYSCLEYNGTVFVGWIGQEFLWYLNAYNTLLATINVIKAGIPVADVKSALATAQQLINDLNSVVK